MTNIAFLCKVKYKSDSYTIVIYFLPTVKKHYNSLTRRQVADIIPPLAIFDYINDYGV